MNDIGSRIRTLRHRRGFSQEQLGFLTGFSQPKISKMENGACDSLSDLKVVAQALDVGIEKLICERPPDHPIVGVSKAEKG